MSSRIIIISDVHLIADNDPHRELHAQRAFFKSAWPSFRRLVQRINAAAPDAVILLGDLIDWNSDENIAFGLSLLAELQAPWHLVLGNHDVENRRDTRENDSLQRWAAAGVEFANSTLTVEGWNLLLLDNALSRIDDTGAAWLQAALATSPRNILCAHVPIDLLGVREFILGVDPNRSLAKYVSHGHTDIIEGACGDTLHAICTGHLHFPGRLQHRACRLQLCPMAISVHDPNRRQQCDAEATVLDLHSDHIAWSRLGLDASSPAPWADCLL